MKMNEVDVEAILNSVYGQFITVVFEKSDGSTRTLNGRLGVSKFAKTKNKSKTIATNGLVHIFDAKVKSGSPYRSFKLSSVKEIRAGRQVFTA